RTYALAPRLLACCTSWCSSWKSLRQRGARRRSCGHLAVVLAGTPPRTLAGDDLPAFEDLPAPDSPGLATLEGAGEAGESGPALPAVLLGLFQIGRGLGEPEIRVLDSAGHVVGALRRDRVEQRRVGEVLEPERCLALQCDKPGRAAGQHFGVTSWCGCGWGSGRTVWINNEAAVPLVGAAASR